MSLSKQKMLNCVLRANQTEEDRAALEAAKFSREISNDYR